MTFSIQKLCFFITLCTVVKDCPKEDAVIFYLTAQYSKETLGQYGKSALPIYHKLLNSEKIDDLAKIRITYIICQYTNYTKYFIPKVKKNLLSITPTLRRVSLDYIRTNGSSDDLKIVYCLLSSSSKSDVHFSFETIARIGNEDDYNALLFYLDNNDSKKNYNPDMYKSLSEMKKRLNLK